MKIVGLGGSLRVGSFAYQALELALKKIENRGIATESIDLKALNLPFCNGDQDYPGYEDVYHLRQMIKNSPALLISTPEYHGNLSGVLKNTLDLLNIEHTQGKVVGLISVVGGVHSSNALNSLRLICRQLGCWVIPEQLIISNAKESFDSKGCLKDQDLDKRLENFVEQLIKTTFKLM